MFKKGDPKPANSGRGSNTPNKATADLRKLAQQYTDVAVTELARLAIKAKNEQARVAAIKELLDRGYGRSVTTAEVTVKNDVRDLTTVEILRALAAYGIVGASEGDDEHRKLH